MVIAPWAFSVDCLGVIYLLNILLGIPKYLIPSRSPWSGEYQSLNPNDKVPATGYKPSASLAQQEAQFNEAFSVYRDLYFGGGVSSVYLWDLDDGFAGAILVKKGTF